MKFYHTCPLKYFDKQYQNNEWHPHYGSTWLTVDPRDSYHASQIKSQSKVIIELELDLSEVEDHSDIAICKRINRPYYLYRGNVSADKVKIFTTLNEEAAE
jgi:hypothetical protein